jgi:hypothetical protein
MVPMIGRRHPANIDSFTHLNATKPSGNLAIRVVNVLIRREELP